jgi:hypothetical protein
MILIDSPRSVCEIVSNRPFVETPNVTNRYSLSEWSGSGAVAESGSRNAVVASANETRCLARFNLAFRESHSNFIANHGYCNIIIENSLELRSSDRFLRLFLNCFLGSRLGFHFQRCLRRREARNRHAIR